MSAEVAGFKNIAAINDVTAEVPNIKDINSDFTDGVVTTNVTAEVAYVKDTTGLNDVTTAVNNVTALNDVKKKQPKGTI